MNKNKIIIIIAISIGLIICIIGAMLNNFVLIIVGPIIAILVFIIPYIKISKRDKSKAFIPEDKYETVLSRKSKKFKKTKNFLSIFIGIVFAIIAFSIIWFFLSNYLYTPSSLSMENIINEGCRKLNPETSPCEKDPSTIIVNYDVNNDGKIGGAGDTLSAILGKQNCTGKCIKERCGCID